MNAPASFCAAPPTERPGARELSAPAGQRTSPAPSSSDLFTRFSLLDPFTGVAIGVGAVVFCVLVVAFALGLFCCCVRKLGHRPLKPNAGVGVGQSPAAVPLLSAHSAGAGPASVGAMLGAAAAASQQPFTGLNMSVRSSKPSASASSAHSGSNIMHVGAVGPHQLLPNGMNSTTSGNLSSVSGFPYFPPPDASQQQQVFCTSQQQQVFCPLMYAQTGTLPAQPYPFPLIQTSQSGPQTQLLDQHMLPAVSMQPTYYTPSAHSAQSAPARVLQQQQQQQQQLRGAVGAAVPIGSMHSLGAYSGSGTASTMGHTVPPVVFAAPGVGVWPPGASPQQFAMMPPAQQAAVQQQYGGRPAVLSEVHSQPFAGYSAQLQNAQTRSQAPLSQRLSGSSGHKLHKKSKKAPLRPFLLNEKLMHLANRPPAQFQADPNAVQFSQQSQQVQFTASNPLAPQQSLPLTAAALSNQQAMLVNPTTQPFIIEMDASLANNMPPNGMGVPMEQIAEAGQLVEQTDLDASGNGSETRSGSGSASGSYSSSCSCGESHSSGEEADGAHEDGIDMDVSVMGAGVFGPVGQQCAQGGGAGAGPRRRIAEQDTSTCGATTVIHVPVRLPASGSASNLKAAASSITPDRTLVPIPTNAPAALPT